MPAICPTVTAFDIETYKAQIELLATFAERIHIDLMDGEFAPTVSPPLKEVWWPKTLVADIHLMYKRPMDHIDELIGLKPSLVVIHIEADVDHADFVRRLHAAGIKAGISILQSTPVAQALDALKDYDHVMIFSGNLGYHGGSAVDFGLLDKVKPIRARYPEIEVSWDGGISDENAERLVKGGIDVLNVGGYIHKAPEPAAAYRHLKDLLATVPSDKP